MLARPANVRQLIGTAGRRSMAACPVTTTDPAGPPPDWHSAKPYTSIPGPTRWQYFKLFRPGGALHTVDDQLSIQRYLHAQYGPLARLPGFLGQRDIVYSFDPSQWPTIWRSETQWPRRQSLDSLGYYRDLRPEIFRGRAAGLLSDNGEQWGRLRSMVTPVVMNPTITRSNMPDVDAIAREFVERVAELRDPLGEMPANFANELDMWALESIGVAALDRRLGVLKADRDPEAMRLMFAIREFLRLTFDLETKPNLWRYITTPKLRALIASLDVITNYITRIIDEANAELERNRPGQLSEISLLQNLLLKGRHYAFLTTYDMMLAGIDTTSSATATLFYHLAINPAQQQKLRDEIFRLLPTAETPITPANFDQFAYFRACYKESMRLQPQIPANVRAAGKDLVLSGYRIPQMTDLFMANNLLHHSEQHFTDAARFVPERWMRSDPVYGAELKARNPFIYLPLGFGPRMCIGKRYAEMEMQCLTARLLRSYRLEWHHEPMKYASAIVISPKNPLKLRMVPL